MTKPATDVDIVVKTDQCFFLLRVLKFQGSSPQKDTTPPIQALKSGTIIRRMIPTGKLIPEGMPLPNSVDVRPPELALSLLTNTDSDSNLSVDLVPIKEARSLKDAKLWLYANGQDGTYSDEAAPYLQDTVFNAVITMSYEWVHSVYGT